MSVFQVELKKVVDDSYEIEIGYHLVHKLIEDIEHGLMGGAKKIAVITDSIVSDLYAADICEAVADAGFHVDMFVFAAGEKSKTRETKEKIEDAMLAKGYRRDCAILAIGGGVVSDLAGFIAGTFARGVPFVTYSTTLLSAADASVGGKTAVDTPLATNLIGLFNQPKKVYIDIDTWKTLPERQLRSGMSETIKHACLDSYEMFTFLEENMSEIYEFRVGTIECDVVRFYPASFLNAIRRQLAAQLSAFRQERPQIKPLPAHGALSQTSTLEVGKELMRMKYCIRHELGLCPAQNPARKVREPLILRNQNRTFRLSFDCKNCEMVVLL